MQWRVNPRLRSMIYSILKSFKWGWFKSKFLRFQNIMSVWKRFQERIRWQNGWLGSPDMNYWPQQLNFAVWCATTGCGVSSRLLYEDKIKDGIHDLTDDELYLPKKVRSFLWWATFEKLLRRLKVLLLRQSLIRILLVLHDMLRIKMLKSLGLAHTQNMNLIWSCWW